MGNPLQAEYDALVRKAAALGLTRVHGRTPRDHMESLLRAGPWLENDVRRLTRLVEEGIYAESEEAAREGRRICRRLAAELPRLPPPPDAPRRRRRWRNPFPAFVVKGGLLLIGGLAIAALAVFAPRIGFGSVPSGGRGGHLVTTESPDESPWTSDREKSSVRDLARQWETSTFDARYEKVVLPEYQRPGSTSSALGFNLQTGVDHHFVDLAEPFDPPLNHHHRQFVFTWIDSSFRFRRYGSPLRNATVAEAPEGARIHRVDVKIRLERGHAVPVPVPAPDSVVVSFEPVPGADLRFVRDPGDALLVHSGRTGDFRLRYVTATPSDYLMAPLPDVPVDPGELRPLPLPTGLRREAGIVLKKIALDPLATYAAKVRRLHAYFAGFVVAPLDGKDRQGSPYLTLALARKGTCGHRAMTFVVTANAAGIPARLVANDVHAFAEVQLPGGAWRALEFRLLDNERERPLRSLTEWVGLGGVTGFLLFVVTTLLLATWATRGTAPDRRATRTRAFRRAERDRREGVTSLLLLRLVRLALSRLSRHLGVPAGDPRALRDALGAGEVPMAKRHAVIALLELQAHTSPDRPMDRYRLREAYWCSKNTLRWMEERTMN